MVHEKSSTIVLTNKHEKKKLNYIFKKLIHYMKTRTIQNNFERIKGSILKRELHFFFFNS